ncbi:MAG TPA: AAA family ATPase [Candidatus Adamsella sp.]|nr:AAA family ATPase [Candidatus Adamsella sp.]
MDIRTELKELMECRNYSIGYISTATGIAKSTISMWINGNYNGKNDKITDAINNFIQRERERSGNNELPYVEISTVKYISEIGRLCHTQGKIGVCVGKAGLGKTVAVKRYTKEFMDSILIESDSGYTAKSLLKEIHRRLGLAGKGSVYDLMDEVIRKLNQSGRLLIIDEAENLPYRALEITRRIHDKTGVGILLVGRGILLENLKGYNNQYDQLYSRVKFTKIIDKILIQDVIKILESIGQNVKLAEKYLFYSDGNTRRLEHLISHSISIAKFNGKAEVDDVVIKQTSKLLMA